MPPGPFDANPLVIPAIASIRLVQTTAYIYAGHMCFAQTSEARELVYCRSSKRVTVKPAGTMLEECGIDYLRLPNELLSGVPVASVQHIESIQSSAFVCSTPPLLSSFLLSESTLRVSSPARKLLITLANRSRAYMDQPTADLQAVILDSNVSLNAKYTSSISISGPGMQACASIATRKVAEKHMAAFESTTFDAALTRLYSVENTPSGGSYCTLCLDQPATVGMNGCGHMVICASCLPSALRSGMVAQRCCPLCRSTEPLTLPKSYYGTTTTTTTTTTGSGATTACT